MLSCLIDRHRMVQGTYLRTVRIVHTCTCVCIACWATVAHAHQPELVPANCQWARRIRRQSTNQRNKLGPKPGEICKIIRMNSETAGTWRSTETALFIRHTRVCCLRNSLNSSPKPMSHCMQKLNSRFNHRYEDIIYYIHIYGSTSHGHSFRCFRCCRCNNWINASKIIINVYYPMMY